ncbi:TetR/AcrR family transcriptional regulator [Salinisphaera sp. LB1]|uniref:TetR/AcrR family transcriptional regulator n=1 Tax=Salinisphaera sp. LB1 TaxID=2183911 RepID=UPI000D707B15|nr:TetR/AcrR family transcriptional regulator [Salinisphaera sp. LB1]AWN17208.1 Transcriptional regulator, TetR family [Salinisphaera sp. LB1]
MHSPRHTAVVRDGILDTATRLFAAQGYRATGINQIIREAGVAKASFYHHFPSKQALGEAFVQRRHERWFAVVEQRLAAQANPRDQLLALFSLWDDQIRAEGFRGCMFVNMAAEFPDPASPIREQIKAHKEAVRALIARLLAAHDAVQGEAKPSPAAADTIYLLYDGAIVESQNFQAVWPIESARRAVAHLLSARAAA